MKSSTNRRRSNHDKPPTDGVSACIVIVSICIVLLSCSCDHDRTQDKQIERFEHYRIDMLSVSNAIEAFHSYYGRMPAVGNGSRNDPDIDNAALTRILLGNTNAPDARTQNPQGVRFLELSESSLLKGQIIDPWGRPYHIAYNTTNSEVVKLGNVMLPARIAIWSDGPNGLNEHGEGDDVCNWK